MVKALPILSFASSWPYRVRPPRGRRMQQFTRKRGEIIYQHDTYIEELGTLCLLQYCLASQEDEATAWYFFNC
ncbi:MAG: DUF4007 family protein [Oscillospiraceae bacterium]